MITTRSWQAARRYVLPLLVLAGALTPAGKRAALAPLGAAGLMLTFFRDPGRVCPAEPGTAYAPTDGTVTAVEDDGRTLKVVTFLAVHNVHVARAPVRGPLAAWSWRPGSSPAASSRGRGRAMRSSPGSGWESSASAPSRSCCCRPASSPRWRAAASGLPQVLPRSLPRRIVPIRVGRHPSGR